MNPLKFLRRGRRDELGTRSLDELLDLQREIRSRALANVTRLRDLRAADMTGLTDSEVRAHTLALSETEQLVRRDEADEAAVRAAVSDAQEVARELAADRDARTLPEQIRAAMHDYADAAAMVRQAQRRVEAVANRLADERVRRRLMTDPTLGIRPALLAVLPVNHSLTRLLRDGVAIALGARARDRFPTLVIVPGDREQDHFEGLELIDTRDRLLAWQRASGGTVVAASRAAQQLNELYRRFGLDPVATVRRLGAPAESAGQRSRREADERFGVTRSGS